MGAAEAIPQTENSLTLGHAGIHLINQVGFCGSYEELIEGRDL